LQIILSLAPRPQLILMLAQKKHAILPDYPIAIFFKLNEIENKGNEKQHTSLYIYIHCFEQKVTYKIKTIFIYQKNLIKIMQL
jgi:hypothetical protein